MDEYPLFFAEFTKSPPKILDRLYPCQEDTREV